MSDSYVHKNGLIYTSDSKTVVGVDSDSSEFTGRIPFGATAIAEEAFAESNVQEISLPDSVKELPPALFENLTELTSVKLPSTLKELPPYLFSGCTSLTKVKMPDAVMAFSEGLFYGCSALQEVPFKGDMQEIPENAFAGCTSLKSIVIPNTVTKISSGAFKDCKSLEAVVISAKLYEFAEDAFEGCDSIRTVRVDPDNHLFYVGNDGCLYEKNIDLSGDDICRIKIAERKDSEESFMDEVDETSAVSEEEMSFVSTDEMEDDDTFSPEIGASEDELNAIDESEKTVNNIKKEENMSDQNDVDAIFADIMNDERERTSGASEEVAVTDKETEVLSHTMEVMAESSNARSVAVSAEELENLFASHEAEATADNESNENSGFDKKTQILVNSVEFSRVIEIEGGSDLREDTDLFVVAENLVETADIKNFSEKLVNCVQKVARIQGFKRIIMLKGLPVDNEEFMQFYFYFINKRNVIFATSATSAATLSAYGKNVCEQSRISLAKDDLAEQRRCVSVKNDSLIKLVVQDLYN